MGDPFPDSSLLPLAPSVTDRRVLVILNIIVLRIWRLCLTLAA